MFEEILMTNINDCFYENYNNRIIVVEFECLIYFQMYVCFMYFCVLKFSTNA